MEKQVRKKITMARKLKGYTQTDIAEVLGIHPMQYGQRETGKIKMSLSDFIKICQFLGILDTIFNDWSKKRRQK